MTEGSRLGIPNNSYNSIPESKKENITDEDEITTYIGSWGTWQTLIFLFLACIGIQGSLQMTATLFFVPDVDYWCKPPDSIQVQTDVWKNFSIPLDKNVHGHFSRCLMYNQSYEKVHPVPMPYEKDERNLSSVPCIYGWEYDKRQLNSTPENEWNLVCDREYLAKSIASTYNFGLLLGSLLYGQLSDITGRKTAIVLGLTSSSMASIMAAFSPSFTAFLVLRFVTAMGEIGASSARFVMLMEMVNARSRTPLSMAIHIPWILGGILICGLAYIYTEWRHLQMAISIPLATYLPFLIFLPESIRWLMAEGRHIEAYEILEKAANMNKKSIPSFQQYFSNVPAKNPEDSVSTTPLFTAFDLFTYPNLRTWTLCLCSIWWANGLLYFGLAMSINSVGDNTFFNVFITSAMEIPSLLLTTIIVMKIGRRNPAFALMFLSGMACFISALFPLGTFAYDWPVISMAIVARFCIYSSFNILYLLSSEIFPTMARNAGIGITLSFNRIGAIASPYVLLLGRFHPSIPFALYGTVAILGSMAVLALPETSDKVMPETFKEAETNSRLKKTKRHSCAF